MARTGVPQGSVATGASAGTGRRFRGTSRYPEGLLVGLDVGSTTVKAVVVDPTADRIVWQDYRRHETRQPETCVEFLERIEEAFPDAPRESFRIFATGSGGAAVGRHLLVLT